MRFVTHIECTRCGQAHDSTRVATVCGKCGLMLAVRYDLGQVAARIRGQVDQFFQKLRAA